MTRPSLVASADRVHELVASARRTAQGEAAEALRAACVELEDLRERIVEREAAIAGVVASWQEMNAIVGKEEG